MRRPAARAVRAAAPARALWRRFGFVALLGLAAALMAMDRSGAETARQLRVAVAEAAAPLLDALSRPIDTIAAAAAEVRGMMRLRAENEALRETVERLRHWETAARRLERENIALKRMARLAGEKLPVFVTGRVIGDSGSPFARTLLVNAGARDGVAVGQAAMTGDGLVGRVVETGRRAARILLVTDLNSRIPVALERSRRRAVLAGGHGGATRLLFLPRDARVAVGDRIVTSGDGGLLPPGLPVGAVAAVSDDGAVAVRPAADLGSLDYVRLIDWSAPALEPVVAASGERAAGPPPPPARAPDSRAALAP